MCVLSLQIYYILREIKILVQWTELDNGFFFHPVTRPVKKVKKSFQI
jgi:hypothetical protein